IFNDEVNLGVRMIKQIVEQILAVQLGKLLANIMLYLLHQGFHFGNQRNGVLRGVDNAVEHKQQPGFPVAGLSHRLQVRVVVRLAVNDKTAQIQNRQVEQVFGNQIEDIQNSSGTAIAIVERVNAFKLVMNDGH